MKSGVLSGSLEVHCVGCVCKKEKKKKKELSKQNKNEEEMRPKNNNKKTTPTYTKNTINNFGYFNPVLSFC